MTSPDPKQQSSRQRAVLVVEDDEDIREAMVGVLESQGYCVWAAHHGEDALAQLRARGAPSIILLDLMMPVMDGWTFCQEKDKDPALAAIPLVVVSAVPRQDPRNACIHAVGHVSKPLDVGKLLAAVERYC
jgi:CheY-like chemotaxis protein